MTSPAAEILEEVPLYADLKGRHYPNYATSDSVIVSVFDRGYRYQRFLFYDDFG
jgi:hypothetical protein